MLKNVTDLTTPGVNRGLNTQYNLLAINKEQSPNMMNVKVTYDGSTEKRLGSNTQNTVVLTGSAGAAFSVATASLVTGLVSYWNDDQASGTRKDIAGPHPMTAYGNPGFSGGKINQAVLFQPESSTYLQAANDALFSTASSWTYSTWFYITKTSNASEMSIITKTDDGDERVTSYLSSTGGTGLIGAGGGAIQQGYAQGFKVSKITQINKAELYMKDYLGAPSDVLITIMTDSSDKGEQPSGTAVAPGSSVGVISSANIAADFSWVVAPFSAGFLLRPGTTYWIQAELQVAGGADVGYWWAYQDAGTYDDGSAAVWTSPSSYNKYPDRDLSFRIYGSGTASTEFEHWLYIDTGTFLNLAISTDGTGQDFTVRADSFGILDTATWYHAVSYYDADSSYLGLMINTTNHYIDVTTNGMYSGLAPVTFGAQSDGGGAFMDGRQDETGYWQRRLTVPEAYALYNGGSGNGFSNSFEAYPWACFDYGASSLRWLTASAGTGVYASSDLGINWGVIGTSQSATYQYMDRSKNVLVITSENYDTPLYWAGSPGTFAGVLNHSGPNCKYSVNFSGYLILLNSDERKRSFNYIDENLQLTGSGWLNFDIPSSADDEITAVFVLRRYLYICTRYKIYRVSYVGGNPDWQYVEVKNWGFIPRTVKKVVLSANKSEQGVASYSIGEVVVGLAYDRKLRIFDGSGDQIISNNIELDNQECPFALNKISYLGSGPIVSFAEIDQNENVYKLCVAIGGDSQQTTHMINYDGRSQALYPYDNQQWNCMVMAESANRRILLALDRSGYCHMLDSGNLDGNTAPIDEYFESPILFEKTPSQASKAHTLDIFFTNRTAGPIYFEQRIEFGDTYKLHRVFNLNGSDRRVIQHERIDIPLTTNAYQFKISTSSGTNDPWQMQRYDYFTQGLGIGAEAKRG